VAAGTSSAIEPQIRWVSFNGCVQNQHLTMSMNMNMSDYGRQAVPPPPSPSQTYDITPLIVKAMKSVKLTCATSA
jgi:hypothetical protein